MVKAGRAKTSAQEAGILWYQQACFHQNLDALRRGVYSAGPSRMQTSDFFGFFRSEKSLHKTNTVIVYPKLVNVKKVDLPRRDLFGKPGNQHPVKDPVYITGTRDYQASSPARHIHWKASARHARLQEKVFEPSQQGKIMVVLDVDGFSDKGLEDAFERTLEVVASLCLQMENSGLAIGFATNGTTIGGDFSLTPTGQGPQQVPAVLEALARVQMNPGKSLAHTMQQAVLPVRGISCICFACENTMELNHMRQAVPAKTHPPCRILSISRMTPRQPLKMRPQQIFRLSGICWRPRMGNHEQALCLKFIMAAHWPWCPGGPWNCVGGMPGLFLTFLSIGVPFPLFMAACILAFSAVLNRVSAKRGWQMYQVVLLNSAGFMACALLFLHYLRYPAYPFWRLEWVGRLVRDPAGIVEWFLLLLTVFCLVLIWRGGSYLKKNPGDYLSVCLQFDKGLGLLFSLLIVNAVFKTRAGVGLPVKCPGVFDAGLFVFGLAAVGLSRHQHDVQKSFLSGYRGLGIIFSIAALTILFGSGMAFLFHPFLFPVADTLLATLDQATTPMVPYLVRFIRYLLVPEHDMISRLPGIEPKTPHRSNFSPPPAERMEAAVANILVWVTLGVVILMVAGLMFYLLKRLLAWLLSEDSLEGPPLTFESLVIESFEWSCGPALRACGVFSCSLFKRIDSAAMVYVRLLRWGRRCGLSKKHNETPDEYGRQADAPLPQTRPGNPPDRGRL